MWVTVCSKKRLWVTGRAQTPVAVEIVQEEVKTEEVKLKPFFFVEDSAKTNRNSTFSEIEKQRQS